MKNYKNKDKLKENNYKKKLKHLQFPIKNKVNLFMKI